MDKDFNVNNYLALKVENLSVEINNNSILKEINLSIPSGDFVGIIGPNGGGKTVFLKTILGLLSPSKGSVEIFGKPHLSALDTVGYVPQFGGFEADYPITVFDMVLMGRINSLHKHKLHFCYGKADRAAAEQAIEQVKLSEKRNAHIGSLSGGQAQRALIARAIVGNPKLLLLDEPTASLDPALGISFFELLKEISKDMTVIMVSHDIGVVASQVKHIACLNKTMHYHATQEFDQKVIEETYGCPLEFIAHGHHAHRVLKEHD